MLDAETLKILIELGQKHAWVTLAAFCIGGFVRLLKTSRATRLPFVGVWIAKIPKKHLPTLALMLGVVSAVLDAVVAGELWRNAIVGGLVSAAIAVMGHQWIIEGVRGGKEIGVKDAPRGAGIMLAAIFAPLTSACGAGQKACAVIDVAEQGCTWLRYLEPGPDGSVAQVAVTPDEVYRFAHEVSVKRAMQARSVDAGVCDGCGGLR